MKFRENGGPQAHGLQGELQGELQLLHLEEDSGLKRGTRAVWPDNNAKDQDQLKDLDLFDPRS